MPRWCNMSENVCFERGDLIRPTTYQALKDALQKLKDTDRCAQIVGHAASTSWVLQGRPGATLLDVSRLAFEDGRRVVRADSILAPAKLDPKHGHCADDLAWVAAGARVHHVLEAAASYAPERTLATAGAWSGQTFIGACQTGTHGSGFHFGTLADLVEAVEVVGFDRAGKVCRRIFQRAGGRLRTGGEVQTNTALWRALVTQFGIAAVVTTVLVRLVKPFHLVELLEPKMMWTDLRRDWLEDCDGLGRPKKLVRDGSRRWQGAGFLIAPYVIAPDRDFPCFVSRMRRQSRKPRGATVPGSLPPRLLQKIGKAWLRAGSAERRIRAVANQLAIDQSGKPWGPAATILTSKEGFGEFAGFGLEYHFDLDGTSRWLDAIEKMLVCVHEAFTRDRLELSGFFSIRFNGPSEALLARRSRPNVAVEVLSASELGQGKQVLSRVEDVALQFGGKPHWGQIFAAKDGAVDAARLTSIKAASRDDLRAFRKTVEKHLDPTRFLNDVTRELWNA